ncbi:formate dehydrogenase subunit beta [Desmospora sp. 8437]|nr:formate dehydrogenase subunit beta [Desmospora sp. 8437]
MDYSFHEIYLLHLHCPHSPCQTLPDQDTASHFIPEWGSGCYRRSLWICGRLLPDDTGNP